MIELLCFVAFLSVWIFCAIRFAYVHAFGEWRQISKCNECGHVGHPANYYCGGCGKKTTRKAILRRCTWLGWQYKDL